MIGDANKTNNIHAIELDFRTAALTSLRDSEPRAAQRDPSIRCAGAQNHVVQNHVVQNHGRDFLRGRKIRPGLPGWTGRSASWKGLPEAN
jgi:hypothetical protein